MKNKTIWIIAAVVLLIGAAFIVGNSLTTLFGGGDVVQAQTGRGQNGQQAQAAGERQNITIRPALDTVQVSATGNIELVDQQSAIFEGEGIIAEVFIAEALQPGDQVVGQLTSFIGEDNGEQRGPRGPFGPPR